MRRNKNDLRPQTSEEIKEARWKSLSVQRDKYWKTENYIHTKISKLSFKLPYENIKINGFLQQNGGIPESYRVNRDNPSAAQTNNTTPVPF